MFDVWDLLELANNYRFWIAYLLALLGCLRFGYWFNGYVAERNKKHGPNEGFSAVYTAFWVFFMVVVYTLILFFYHPRIANPTCDHLLLYCTGSTPPGFALTLGAVLLSLFVVTHLPQLVGAFEREAERQQAGERDLLERVQSTLETVGRIFEDKEMMDEYSASNGHSDPNAQGHPTKDRR